MGSLVVVVDQRTNGCVKPSGLFLARHQIQLSEVSKHLVSCHKFESYGCIFILLCLCRFISLLPKRSPSKRTTYSIMSIGAPSQGAEGPLAPLKTVGAR